MTVIYRSDNLDPLAPAATVTPTLPALHVGYQRAALDDLLKQADVLAVIGFGSAAPAQEADARYLRVALEPVENPARFEVWRSRGKILQAREGNIRWASDGDYSFGSIELDETAHYGIAMAAEHAYQALSEWLATASTPHVLRIWNYLDAINAGEGDDERYREFCQGRARGMGDAFARGFPAATAIGVRDGRRVLQVYWIAARSPGAPVENPRQISAWQYPRQYGPASPSFARAMRAPTHSPQLYISGTAAIVGHASHHREDFAAQLQETLANLDSVIVAAVGNASAFDERSLFKAYVRAGVDEAYLQSRLAQHLALHSGCLLLRGDICRRELLVEIEGVQGG